jgi:Transposase, Mutator family
MGDLRFRAHRTREEIWRRRHEEQAVAITERHVQHLLEVYLALLRASEEDLEARLGPVAREHGGLLLALDGLQPEQGNDQLGVVRELHSGVVVAAAPRHGPQQASAPCRVPVLRPVQQTGLPVLGVVSDAQQSVRLAVAEGFPGVPHQRCQYHALREATERVWEADRHLLVRVKQELRALRAVEERTRQQAAERQAAGQAPDPIEGVVLDTVLALRQVVRERGTQPLDFGALRVLDQLAALGETLDRGLANKGIPDSLACAPC